MNTFVQFVATLVLPSLVTPFVGVLLETAHVHRWLVTPTCVITWIALFMLGHELTQHLPAERRQGRVVSIGAGLAFLAKLFGLYLGIYAAALAGNALSYGFFHVYLSKPIFSNAVEGWNGCILRGLFGTLPDGLATLVMVATVYVTFKFVLQHLPIISATSRHLQGRHGLLTSKQARRRLR